MRPILGDDALVGRSRSNDDTVLLPPTPMTYFLTDEKSMKQPSSSHPILNSNLSMVKKDGTGLESYETTSLLAGDVDDSYEMPRLTRQSKNNFGDDLTANLVEDQAEGISPYSSPSANVSRNASPSRTFQNTLSRPYTPLSFHSPAPNSLMSSPGSRLNYNADFFPDDPSNQVKISNLTQEQGITLQSTDCSGAPQLVMPSLKMPSRRPFTENDVGKTSLLKAIVQTCEDIVHVDSICVPTSSKRDSHRNISNRKKSRNGTSNSEATSHITEIYASTKPYPAWWSELDECRILKRRNSGETVLERNLCFVDTPGYGNQNSQLECASSVIDYIEAQFRKISTFNGLSESEMINMLSGNGGDQAIDIEYLRRLSRLTSIIPIIAHADVYSEEEISIIKQNIHSELRSANIKPFLFRINSEQAQDSTQPFSPFAVSSSVSKDLQTMDASLLMSPDYVQPLIDSELKALVAQLFEHDTISWLRHLAAKKYVHWRISSLLDSTSQSLSQIHPIPLMSQVLTAPVGATTAFALARITDHTQREERIAQVRLANWAAELQRSLQDERIHFEDLARKDRAVWLTKRLSECVQDGTIIPVTQVCKEKFTMNPDLRDVVKPGLFPARQVKEENFDKNDPLGLILLSHKIKQRGWAILKIAGSLGIFSGLAIWVTRRWRENWQIGGLEMRDWVGLVNL
ncbi:RAS like GTPase superfamily protein [Blumeria hordei DH14]|uniref:RAS like GTPase superfamily protein n=1 Tax=Blumeria graminis f. sp. hordei (strain DH14) TaxID=546991 RepID=N1JDS7_BLUG1|nr:RAS like GTPase superfamily protein [Blumeria hordei DH14]